jgi:hypothetical protein
VSETVLNPVVLLAILIAGVLILMWPRRKALTAFLTAAILIPTDQVLLLGPAHFPMLRVLILFGIIRMVKDKSSKRPLFSGGMNRIDISFISLTIVVAVSGILLFQASGEVIFQLGNVLSALGAYCLVRFFIRDEEDIFLVIRTFAWIIVVIAPIMTYERISGHNPYSFLGGARAASMASLMERDGKFRATGCFAHPILAGTFGAVLVPLFVSLWAKDKKYRVTAAIGIAAAAVMAIMCNSSTPVLAYAAGVLALCMWPIRDWMRAVRWGIVLTLITLHMVMKQPVWHLITRIDLSGGSSSWHRFMLVDQCIRHFGDWWLVGVKDTGAWGWDMWDTANQYVALCDGSGLLAFLLFLSVLVYGFKYVGRARRAVRRGKKKAFFFWGLGSALFANVVAFVGITYADQSVVAWYCLLASISVAIAITRASKAKIATPETRSADSFEGTVPAVSEEISFT